MNTAETLNIETMLPWGSPKDVETKNGPRVLRTAFPAQDFWTLWKDNKETLKDAGVSCGKNKVTGQWEVCWWKNNGVSVPKPVEQPIEVKSSIAVTVPSHIASKLLEYQVQPVAEMVSSLMINSSWAAADDTGVGKTFMALGACAVMNKRAVVLTPKAVIPGWKKAAKYIGVDCVVFGWEWVKTGKSGLGDWKKEPLLKYGKPVYEKDGKTPKTHDIFHWTVDKNDILVFDEAHRAKAGRKSDNGHILIRAKEMASVPIMLLSATLAETTLDMEAIGYAIGLFPKNGFYRWAMRNGVTKTGFGGSLEFTGGKSALNKIHHSIFKCGRGGRLRSADLKGFPETLISADSIDFNGNGALIQQAYDDMAEALSHLDEVELKDRQGIILTEILRARQRTEILKIPTTSQMALDAVDEGMSVAIFVNFNQSVDSLATKLKTKCVVRGGQKDAEREQNIADFQSGKERIIILNSAAGGVGISLHDLDGKFPRLSLIFPNYSARVIKQVFGRVHRAGGKSKSRQMILFASGTIEDDAQEACNAKIRNIDTLNDGDLSAGQPEAVASFVSPDDDDMPGYVAQAVQPSEISVTVNQPVAKKDAPQVILPKAIINLAHQAMRIIAGMDNDHAQEVNGIGFSKMDGGIGHSFAERDGLSMKQGAYAARLAVKYKKQLPTEMVEQIKEALEYSKN